MSRVVVNKPQPLEPQFAKERDRVQAAFGKRVREFRTERQLTLEMLAEKADLHENYVGAVERGERNLSLYNVWRLAHGLGLPVAVLVQDLPARNAKRATASYVNSHGSGRRASANSSLRPSCTSLTCVGKRNASNRCRSSGVCRNLAIKALRMVSW